MPLDSPHFDKATLVTFPLTERSAVVGKIEHLGATPEDFVRSGVALIKDAKLRAQTYRKKSTDLRLEFQKLDRKQAEIPNIDAAISDLDAELDLQHKLLDMLSTANAVGRVDKRNAFHRLLKRNHEDVIAAFTDEHTAMVGRYYLLLAFRAEADVSSGTMISSADQLDFLLGAH